MDPANVYRWFLDRARTAVLLSLITWKGGAFVSKVNASMELHEIIRVLISSDLTTEDEKKLLRVGYVVATEGPDQTRALWNMPLVRVYNGIGVFLIRVFGVFLAGRTIVLSTSFHLLNHDGSVSQTTTIAEDGRILATFGGSRSHMICIRCNETPGPPIITWPPHIPPVPLWYNEKRSKLLWKYAVDTEPSRQVLRSVVALDADCMIYPEADVWGNWTMGFQKSLVKHAQAFQKGAFRSQVTPTTDILDIFKLLFNSPQSSPYERKILCLGGWIYLEAKLRFGDRARGWKPISYFQSILLLGIFKEKVFQVFRSDMRPSGANVFKWSFEWEGFKYTVDDDWKIVKNVLSMMDLMLEDTT